MSFENQFGIFEPIPITARSHVIAQNFTFTVQQKNIRRWILERTALDLFEKSFSPHRHLFNNWDSFLRTLQKSINDGFLKELCVYGCKHDTYVFCLAIEIDWEVHRILSKNIDLSKIDSSKSIAQQVDDAIPQIVSFIQDKAQYFKIDNLVSVYKFTKSDFKTSAERLRITETEHISNEHSNKIVDFENNSHQLHLTPGNLEELLISCSVRTRNLPIIEADSASKILGFFMKIIKR
jgi:hypothetical protein